MMTGLLQPTHIIVVLIVALVVLGPKRIPEAARALGHGLREFKDSIGGHDEDHVPALGTPSVGTTSSGEKVHQAQA